MISSENHGVDRFAKFVILNSMSITATVINDTIRLPEGTHLEDGTQVIVLTQPIERKSFAERYKKFIGSVNTGLGDLAENHDHYLHGTPKKTKP